MPFKDISYLEIWKEGIIVKLLYIVYEIWTSGSGDVF